MESEVDRGTITRLLVAWNGGDEEAPKRLFPIVYHQLRRMAYRQVGRQAADVGPAATEVVHEVYLKLMGPGQVSLRDRQHFYALAARAMRQILIDQARRSASLKRGGQFRLTPMEGKEVRESDRPAEILALDGALEELEEVDAGLYRVVELRFFCGLSVVETAEVLETSTSTVKREWAKARAFLYRLLRAPRNTP